MGSLSSPLRRCAAEAVDIPTGTLITAVHSWALAAFTDPPNPMGFLNRILWRSLCEKPLVEIVLCGPHKRTLRITKEQTL
ncbi:MAG: hypothetical protein DME46_08605 [Verrucomicrobia bacterium]|nr:MAG: hypothetical protein DME46_08605 [Verrucomicrobiota bacterium]